MMQKQDIIHSLKVLEMEDEIEILKQSKNTICIFDFQDDKEITYTFHRSKTALSSCIHISKRIPKEYRPNREKLIQYILRLPADMLLTLNKIWFMWNIEDYEDMAKHHEVDSAWVNELWDEDYLGRSWFDQNTVMVNVQNIVNCAEEIATENLAFGLHDDAYHNSLEQIVVTLVHELRHIMMDTNIILPEDEYPIHLASEAEVETFARSFVEQYGYNVF